MRRQRARFVTVRLRSDRSPVTVLAGESAVELGQRLCEAVVPARPADTPVLVKPNLCGFDGFKTVKKPGGDDGVAGRVTDVEFTRGVVRCLKARGHRRITVADGCGNLLQCGTCSIVGESCGGGGTASVCGAPTCTPKTAADCGSNNCGFIADGCGGTVACGVGALSGRR